MLNLDKIVQSITDETAKATAPIVERLDRIIELLEQQNGVSEVKRDALNM